MALTTEDYTEMGRNSAARGEMRASSMREGSWQLQAWLAGHDSVTRKKAAARQAGKTVTLSLMLDARRAESFALWPKGAAEHFRLLAHDIATCKSLERQQRLMRAVNRMVRRHGKLQKPTAGNEPIKVWIDECPSTQEAKA